MTERDPTPGDHGLITAAELARLWEVDEGRVRSILSAHKIKRVSGYPRDLALRSSVRPGRGTRTDLAKDKKMTNPTAYAWPTMPGPGATAKSRNWTYVESDGVWFGTHNDMPDQRPQGAGDLRRVLMDGPLQVTEADGREYELALPASPSTDVRLRGRSGKVYDGRVDAHSGVTFWSHGPNAGDGAEWAWVLREDGPLTVVEA